MLYCAHVNTRPIDTHPPIWMDGVIVYNIQSHIGAMGDALLSWDSFSTAPVPSVGTPSTAIRGVDGDIDGDNDVNDDENVVTGDAVFCDATHALRADTRVYEHVPGVVFDLSHLMSLPHLCDTVFLVGDSRRPVHAVGAILAVRSRCPPPLLYDVNT